MKLHYAEIPHAHGLAGPRRTVATSTTVGKPVVICAALRIQVWNVCLADTESHNYRRLGNFRVGKFSRFQFLCVLFSSPGKAAKNF